MASRLADAVMSAEPEVEAPIAPAFVHAFPPTPELRRLTALFVAGDYRRCAEEAATLAERTGDPRVKAAALELKSRAKPDALALAILAGTGLLLAAMTVYWMIVRP